MNKPRILIADDHRILAEALQGLIQPEFEVVAIVEDGQAMVDTARWLKPEVIIADITMPHLNGIEALAVVLQDNPLVKVVCLTMHRELAFVRRALAAGAVAYVLKHSAPSELVLAIRNVLAGRTFLTPSLAAELAKPEAADLPKAATSDWACSRRQIEVLQLIAEGRSAKEIGSKLHISSRTVEFHKQQMMKAWKAHSGAELIRMAIQRGLIAL